MNRTTLFILGFTIESACRACEKKGDEQKVCAETGFIEKVIKISTVFPHSARHCFPPDANRASYITNFAALSLQSINSIFRDELLFLGALQQRSSQVESVHRAASRPEEKILQVRVFLCAFWNRLRYV